ncbi:hypothetical protein FSP39_004645 [Pinctada imbricata]|uniref:Hemoglobinase n=1 Tax=Pinctada imbricata TaxID=66713 RepID=A0AA88Y250_PINIB|nr:hypothetical protein FSP39_004645 [Pinctada imbricata]
MYLHFIKLLCVVSLAYSLPKVEFPKLKEGGKIWALLVAGSNGWGNYRHQADACHAYQVVRNHGIPEEQIVVMMVDDIANNSQNPTPGKIINQPDGPDVYQGVKIDYSGLLNVVPEVFLKVMSGDSSGLSERGTGRVINSGPNDHVFVNFVDHGGPGIIAFGRLFLHAKDLMETLADMHKAQKFDKLLFYMEACESGSMFYNLLPKDYNILALTASNPDQSSYACYWDEERETYLGDVFSVNWLQDSDKEDLAKETIKKQFHIIKKETNTSVVCEYGDKTIAEMTVSEFQGKEKSTANVYPAPDPNIGAVPSENVDLEILKYQYRTAMTEDDRMFYLDKLEQETKRRESVPVIVKKIVDRATNNINGRAKFLMDTRYDLYDTDCYKTVVEHLADNCPMLGLREQFGYALKHLYAFVNLCEENVAMETILSAIDKEESCFGGKF